MDDIIDNSEIPSRDNSDYYNLAKKAQSYGAQILASPWTPPAEWKNTLSRVGGGHLKPEFYNSYVEHLKNYVTRMKNNGVTINALSYQNEPDIAVSYDGCDWSSAEMLAFVKQIGNQLKDIEPNIKLIPGEPYQFSTTFLNPILNDSEAVNYVDIIAGHVYGGGLARKDLAITKGKEVWMTEHLLNTANNYNYDSTWDAAWALAKEVHDCMAADFNAYIWWYAKRFYSLIGDGEYQTIDGVPLPRGYVLSHYAKYASKKTRVKADLTTSVTGVFVTAYESADDISLVLFNQGDTDADVVNITLPAAAASVSGVISGALEGNMTSSALYLSSDKKTGTIISLPAKTIMSVKFVKQ
jgi:O-glycosyl hydrolase